MDHRTVIRQQRGGNDLVLSVDLELAAILVDHLIDERENVLRQQLRRGRRDAACKVDVSDDRYAVAVN